MTPTTQSNAIQTNQMQVAAIQPDGSLGVSLQAVPVLPVGGALLQLLGCGLCGSDLDKVVNAKSPVGTVLGHEAVGRIIELDGAYHGQFRVGDRIVVAHHTPCGACHFCRHDSESMCRVFKQSNFVPGGFAEVIALSDAHLKHTAFKIPDGMTDAQASCVEPLACTLRAINRLNLKPGQSVTVVGLGFIGLMAAQWFHQQGVLVSGLELDAARLQLAQSNGWLSSPEILPAQTDAVFLTAVNAKTLELAFSKVRDGGQLMLFTSAPPQTHIDPSDLYFREINLLTSYSPALSDLAEAARLIFTHTLDVKSLVTHQLPLSKIDQALDLYQHGGAIKVFLTSDNARNNAS